MNDRLDKYPLTRRASGFSLIEILVALAIAALLLLGLSQIFIGSKAAYTVQAGMSRSQENARFIFSFFEDNIRMAGYYGCGNEKDASLTYFNHIIAGPASDPTARTRFNRPLQGYDYATCNNTACPGVDNADPVAGALASWSPTLVGSDIAAADMAVAGSDILVLRVLSAQSTPVLGPFNPLTGTFTLAPVPNDANFASVGGVYAVTNCRPRVDLFMASAGSGGNVLIGAAADNQLRGPVANDTWGFTNAHIDFPQPPAGSPPTTMNAEMHKAEYMAIFVGLKSGNPALRVKRFSGAAGAGLPGLATDEIADGVENMQVQYGVDSDGDGIADTYQKASEVVAGIGADPLAIDAAWRKVVSVRVSLLMRSQDPASTPTNSAGNVFDVGGAKGARITRRADGRFRDVYETTIAIRNRLPTA